MIDGEYISTLRRYLRTMNSPQCDMAASLIGDLQSRLDSLEKDAELLDWLGTAPAGCIRIETNPLAPTYINYSASGGDIRSALTKAMQSQGKTND